MLTSDLYPAVEEELIEIERLTKINEEKTGSVTKCEEKYQLIDNAILGCQQAVAELNSLGHEMVEMKNLILTTMEGLSSIAEENSSATEEVNSLTIQQASVISSLSEYSENLALLCTGFAKYCFKV